MLILLALNRVCRKTIFMSMNLENSQGSAVERSFVSESRDVQKLLFGSGSLPVVYLCAKVLVMALCLVLRKFLTNRGPDGFVVI